MPTVTLQVSLDGGGPQSGAIDASPGQTVDLSLLNPTGVSRVLYEIYSYPSPWTGPASGWTYDSSQDLWWAQASSGGPAPQFALPDDTMFGKVMLRATGNGGLVNGKPSLDLIDEATCIRIYNPYGVTNIGHQEGNQFGGWDRELRKAIEVLAGIVGGGADLSLTVLSPAALAANQNDWAPVDSVDATIVFADADIIRAQCDATPRKVTGLQATGLGDKIVKTFVNVGANPMVFLHQSSSSAAANRLTMGNGADLILGPNEAAKFVYDSTSTTWRLLAHTALGFGTATSFSATTLTLSLAHANRHVRYTGSSTTTVTVPPDSSCPYPIGTLVQLTQAGTGTVEVVAGSGVAINSYTWTQFITKGTYAHLFLRKIAANTWDIWGDLQEIVHSISNSHSTQQDNYNPLFWQDARLVGINPTSAMSITGFASPQPGGTNYLYYWEHQKWIYNRNASNNLTIKHQSTSSSLGNRVACSTGADIVIGPNQGKPMIYDGSTGVWRMFA